MARAAFFELFADYFGRPSDDGVIRALLDAGFLVDVFAPGGELPQSVYDDRVRRHDVTFRRTWLQSHLRRSFVRHYDLFLGTADLPMAFAGALAKLARKPLVTVCDEVFIGGLEGAAVSVWKNATRWAMRQSELTVITDLAREPLQRAYAALPPEHPFVQYPSCFATPYAGRSRDDVRRSLGVADDELVLSFTGALSETNGAEWLVRLIDRLPPKTRVLIQPGGRPPAVVDALVSRLDRTIYRPDRLSWRDAAELTNAADISLVFYRSTFPEFLQMGLSSQKLCTSLWLGIPVVATTQPSFHFIRDYGCGELIERQEEIVAAIERIAADRDRYAANCRRAMEEYVKPAERLRDLTARFAEVRDRRS